VKSEEVPIEAGFDRSVTAEPKADAGAVYAAAAPKTVVVLEAHVPVLGAVEPSAYPACLFNLSNAELPNPAPIAAGLAFTIPVRRFLGVSSSLESA
jgi:hypothetical protein